MADEPASPIPDPVLHPGPSFDALFTIEYPKMVALAAAIGGRAHAEDVAQEAMARLNDRWPDVAGYDKPGAWLRRVTINLAVSRRRRLLNEARALLRLDRIEPTLRPPPTNDTEIWDVVAALPAKQRTVVALHYLEDRSTEDIADLLGIAPSTVRVHLHRARQTLRQQLDGEAPR